MSSMRNDQVIDASQPASYRSCEAGNTRREANSAVVSELWSDKTLPLKDRGVATLAAVIALGLRGSLAMLVNDLSNYGVTSDDFDIVLDHLSLQVGWAKVVNSLDGIDAGSVRYRLSPEFDAHRQNRPDQRSNVASHLSDVSDEHLTLQSQLDKHLDALDEEQVRVAAITALAAVVALGKLPAAAHSFTGCIAAGLSTGEVLELLRHLSFYVGYIASKDILELAAGILFVSNEFQNYNLP